MTENVVPNHNHLWIWNYYREYAGCGGINVLTGAICPCLFLWFCATISKQTLNLYGGN